MTSPQAIWLDMQLPPAIRQQIESLTGMPCQHFADLRMHTATDRRAFEAGREAGAVIVSKDADFAQLVHAIGPPPFVVWLRCGNCTTTDLVALLDRFLPPALDMIRTGEPLVEIADHPPVDPRQG